MPSEISDSEQVIQKFENFFNTFYNDELLRIVREGESSIKVDFRELDSFDIDLADDLLNRPRDILACAEEAITRLDLGEDFVELKVRFEHLPESQAVYIRDVRSDHLGKFICIEGLIRQASDVRPEILEATFDCPNCGNLIIIPQTGPHLREPTKCICGRKGKFRMTDKKLTDMQKLEVEELPDNLIGGEQAKRLRVFIRDDLVDPGMGHKVIPGTEVFINGTLGEVTVTSSHGQPTRRLDIFLDANFIDPKITQFEDIEVTPEDEEEIRRLAADPHIYKKLKESIAPSIYGYEDIKEALSLFLFGGIRKRRKDGTETRGDIHILLIGDPGAGKSMMLKYIEKMAPKARYVSGKGASAAGLTASVVKDEFLKAWVLEAGTLVLANKGIACIDELDKMTQDDRSAMHEAMAQQTVTISKASIQATLKAQTAILAAANPKHGRFDPYQPPADQIDLPPTLINRFDLIFPIRDKPDREKDTRMAEHILHLHSSVEDQKEPPISQDILRKYISFAKRNSSPRLTEAAIQEIKNFFVGLRGQYSEKERSVPISVRQLESMIRLAEASARVRLSDRAEAEDAQRAIRLIFAYLKEVGFDPETGKLDIDRASGVTPASKRNLLTNVLGIIRSLEEVEGTAVKTEDVIREAGGKGMDELAVEKVIRELMQVGEIFEPQRGYIKRL
ncbi:MAG: minichromosome maintenance protein MCM [Candidatus Undinarchaeales archaeon]|nr:minichromosome maintenance protein MCM [Candidatus Undinarchaeales archaeon]